ncbi:MAG: hypothetical protein WD898_01985 [Candidatus Paceibacterota bacterium]
MTVYSGTINQSKTSAVKIESTPIFGINLILVVLLLAGVVGYIFLSNFITSQKYSLGVLKKEFNQVSAAASIERDTTDYDIPELLEFAQSAGMIEAKDTGTVLEESGFALSEDRI